MPFASRIRSFVKNHVDSPWLKLALFIVITTLFVVVVVGLAFTAIEPVTHRDVPLSGLASAIIGFTLVALVGVTGLICYLLNEILGDILKGIAKRL